MNQKVITITKSGDMIADALIVELSSTGSTNQSTNVNREQHNLTEEQLNRILAIIRE